MAHVVNHLYISWSNKVKDLEQIKAQEEGKLSEEAIEQCIKKEKRTKQKLVEEIEKLEKNRSRVSLFREISNEQNPYANYSIWESGVKQGAQKGFEAVKNDYVDGFIIAESMLNGVMTGNPMVAGGTYLAEKSAQYLLAGGTGLLGSILGTFGAMATYAYNGYIVKPIAYSGNAKVAHIKCTWRNGKLQVQSPSKEHLDIQESNEGMFKADVKNHVGPYTFKYTSKYAMHADVCVELFVRKCDHPATQEKINNNRENIEAIDRRIQGWKVKKLNIKQRENKKNQLKKEIESLNEKLRANQKKNEMFDVWSKYFFDSDPTSKQTLIEYVNHYKEWNKTNTISVKDISSNIFSYNQLEDTQGNPKTNKHCHRAGLNQCEGDLDDCKE